MNKLNSDIKLIWAFGYLAQAIVIGAILFVSEITFASEMFEEISSIGFVVPSIITVLLLIRAGVLPFLHYKIWAFEIKDDEICIERGLLVRRNTSIPVVRIQHIDVNQGIFDRMFGLSRLILFTAGTKRADLRIPGLPVEYAEAVRDRLKNLIVEDVV